MARELPVWGQSFEGREKKSQSFLEKMAESRDVCSQQKMFRSPSQ